MELAAKWTHPAWAFEKVYPAAFYISVIAALKCGNFFKSLYARFTPTRLRQIFGYDR
jgi:hypothetical protein